MASNSKLTPEQREIAKKRGKKYNDRRKAGKWLNREVAHFLCCTTNTVKRFHSGVINLSPERLLLYDIFLTEGYVYDPEENYQKPRLTSTLDCLYKNKSTEQMRELMSHPKIGPAIPDKWLIAHGLMPEPVVEKPKSNSDIKGFKKQAKGGINGQLVDEFAGEI